MISIVVTLCHLVTIDPQSKPLTACMEKIVGRIEWPMNSCWQLQTGIAMWKERGPYAGEDYYIGGYRCENGDYEVRDAT